MSRLLHLLFFLFLLSVFCFGQGRTSEIAGWKGPVREVTRIYGDTIRIAEFDSKGNCLYEQRSYFGCSRQDFDVTSSNSWQYLYNSKGQCIEEHNSYSYMIVKLDDGESNDHIRDYYYTYNPKGLLIKEFSICTSSKETPGGTILYSHDNQGNRIDAIEYMSDQGPDSLQRKSTYKYNKEMQRVESIEQKFMSGKIWDSKTSVTVYDKEGRKIESYDKGLNGKRYSLERMTYDSLGRLAEIKKYTDTTLSSQWVYSYSDEGSAYEYTSYWNEGISDRYQIHFDKNGNKLKAIYYRSDGSVSDTFTFSYEYDTYGNWIKCTNHHNNFDPCVEERIITYWP